MFICITPISRPAQAEETVGDSYRLLNDIRPAANRNRIDRVAPHGRRAQQVGLLKEQPSLGGDPTD